MKNTGLKWNGHLAMPATSMCNYTSSLDDSDTATPAREVGFVTIEADVDEDLIAEARQFVQPPYPPKTYISRFRGSKQIHLSLKATEGVANKGLIELVKSGDESPNTPLEKELNATSTDLNQAVVLKSKQSDTPYHKTSDRLWYLLPRRWAYVILSLCVAYGIFFLLKKGKKVREHKNRSIDNA